MQIPVSAEFVLDEYQSTDAEALVKLLNDPEIAAQTLRIPHPYTADDAQNWLRQVVRDRDCQDRPRHWVIRHVNGSLCGGIGLAVESRVSVAQANVAQANVAQANDVASLGYWLAPEWRRQGVMTAAVRALCDYSFALGQLTRIEAEVFPANLASVRLLRRCGFVEEGYLRQCHLKHGARRDVRLFSRLATDTVPREQPAVRMKQVIVMRHDLGMRRGKQIAQGAHAAMAFLTSRLSRQSIIGLHDFTVEQQQWLTGAFAKICCRVNSEEQLLEIERQARAAGLEVQLIVDSGKTEFHGQPTRTCLAIGPAPADQIDLITGHLELL